MVVGDFPHMGKFLRKRLDGFKIQTKAAIQDVITPDFLGLELTVRGAAVSRVTVPAVSQLLDCLRNIHRYRDSFFTQNTKNLAGGSLFAGVIHIDILQRAAHIEQNGINHNLTAFSKNLPL